MRRLGIAIRGQVLVKGVGLDLDRPVVLVCPRVWPRVGKVELIEVADTLQFEASMRVLDDVFSRGEGAEVIFTGGHDPERDVWPEFGLVLHLVDLRRKVALAGYAGDLAFRAQAPLLNSRAVKDRHLLGQMLTRSVVSLCTW